MTMTKLSARHLVKPPPERILLSKDDKAEQMALYDHINLYDHIKLRYSNKAAWLLHRIII